MESVSVGIRPLGVAGSAVLFFIPATILYWTHFYFVPAFVGRTGSPYLLGYLIGWCTTMALFFVAALVGYRLEGCGFKWQPFAARFRLARMRVWDWVWALGLFALALGVYVGLGFTSQWLARIPFFAPHPLVPPDFGPEAARARVPGSLMGMPLAGKTCVALVFLWRVAAEHLGRGVLVPRLLAAAAGACAGGAGVDRRRPDVWIQSHLAALEPAADCSDCAGCGLCRAAAASHLDSHCDAWVDESDAGCERGVQRGRRQCLVRA